MLLIHKGIGRMAISSVITKWVGKGKCNLYGSSSRADDPCHETSVDPRASFPKILYIHDICTVINLVDFIQGILL